ncbi:thiol-disulfide oxidoreductase DCC family protein [Effusibacillus consociatus]|uniref:Thiol-disulfide oxidoreductase DCC family protein n=1 Tax=Effusibacillus consociatus TaxID=1117041 RepID=A0ABV9Q580_9BACL
MNNTSLVLFDGVCNFCNYWVNFIIRRDRHRRFRFASLQSETAQAMLAQFFTHAQIPDSIVLIEKQKCFTQSTAVLHICKKLDGLWKLLFIFILVPKPLRDWVYRWVAKNRYKFWGRRDSCMNPTKDVRDRFLI